MYNLYDRNGTPIDIWAWCSLYEDDHYRQIVLTAVYDNVDVSTVWLGVDHNFWSPGKPPIIFETMVFGGLFDKEQYRYATEAQAIAGHDQIVAKVRQALVKNDGC